MNDSISRRGFVAGVGATAIGATAGARALASFSSMGEPRVNRDIKKAVKLGMVKGDMSLLEKFKLLKRLGYDGVEPGSPNGYDTKEMIAARDETGLTIHGVVDSAHWGKPFSHPDSAVRAEGVKALETALHDCKDYGGDCVLVVPAVVNKSITYDDAYRRSQEEIRRVLPLAEELNIRIAFENVWNQFLLSPMEAARYVDEFESPLVGWYFDVGNIVNYGWPEQWVRILDHRIFKLDIKEYSRTKRDQEGLWKGFNVKLLEGDCDWPAVMKAIDDIGFSGWATAEVGGGGEERLRDIAERMDRILES